MSSIKIFKLIIPKSIKRFYTEYITFGNMTNNLNRKLNSLRSTVANESATTRETQLAVLMNMIIDKRHTLVNQEYAFIIYYYLLKFY
ncbi:MAG: hypothetical protein FWE13_05285 [Firmicutes bacterium]|nr:hypothetical protein [Bacillota bacterium]